MAENQPNREPIRVFDVQDRKFTMWVFALSSAITIGLSLVSMAASFQLGSDTATGGHKEFLLGLARNYLYYGIVAFGIGTVLAYFTNRRIALIEKQGHRAYNPKNADNFVVVIEGIGSHGNPEKDGQADNIMETAIKQIVDSGGTVASARFYSSSGVRNLLKQQLQ